MVEQTNTSEQIPFVRNNGRDQGIGPSSVPSTQPVNPWGGLVDAMGQQLINTMERVELFNGKGGLIEGCIERIDRTGLDFMALEDPKIVLPQTTQWHVFAAFGTLKGGRADWLVEKCTELGACSVTPLLTERSPSISENRVGRLQRVNLAAAKQCQRLHEMTLNPPTKIGGLLPIVAQSKLCFVALAEAAPVISALTSSRTESSGSIIIGPEGDFTEKEMDLIIEAGATAVGLGPHRLRVETATMALLATVMLWSDSLQPLDSLGEVLSWVRLSEAKFGSLSGKISEIIKALRSPFSSPDQ
ncbi:hypothetical protein TEA_018069 [Camellia sinensis var. sinensis]|uniref:16S rRNA (uracil(1498)-N(3))-methyltransferase n=1 Tax=Camellia sinensis var. sinensis TaxID=542762 RepID=A0A4S4DIW7_CAMSN|nr:hypothetical protein TEA_018069 [Camellia sinensis var. sinensis]